MTPNVPEENALLRAAEQQVERLTRPTKRLVRWLTALCVLLVLVAAALGYFAYANHELSTRLQKDSVQSCEQGNVQRANQTQIWDGFITILLKGNTNPADAAKGKAFEEFVGQVDSPRNCQQVYNVSLPQLDR